jgi:hypothetical protein
MLEFVICLEFLPSQVLLHWPKQVIITGGFYLGCKKGGSRFPGSRLPMSLSNLPYVDVHCMDLADSGVKRRTHVSSPVTIHRRNVFPSSSNWFRCLADTETRCAFWSNISIFGAHCVHTFLNN